MGYTANHLWPYPDLTPNPADGPAAFKALASAIEATWVDSTISTYTPGWTSAGGTAANLAKRIGWYRREGSWCDVGIFLEFDATTTAGTGQLTTTLPFPGVGLTEQLFLTKLWVPSTGMDFHGTGTVAAGTANVVSRFPASPTDARALLWQSANGGAGLGTGIPAIAGAFTIQNGGNYSLHGRYKVA